MNRDERFEPYDFFRGSHRHDAVPQQKAHRAERDRSEQEIGSGTGERHQRRAARVTDRPLAVVGDARPTDHPTVPPLAEKQREQERKDRDDDHPERRAPDVGRRVERHVTERIRRRITAPVRDKGVCGFVAGRAEDEHEVPNREVCDFVH